VDERLTALVDTSQAVASSVAELPQLFAWIETQLTDDWRRRFWARVLQGVGLMLGAGVLFAWLVSLLVREPALRLRPTPEDGQGRRFLVRAAAFALDLLPIGGFLLAASIILRLQPLAPLTVQVGSYAALAVALHGVMLKLTRHALDPEDPARRWVSLDNEQARSTAAWIRRIGTTAIYGYFGLRAGDRLGLPTSLALVLAHILFIAVAAMITIWIVRTRESIGRAVREAAKAAHEIRFVSAVVPFEALARSGYVLAIVLVWAHYAVWAIGLPGGFTYLFVATTATVAIFLVAQIVLIALGRLQERWLPEPSRPEETIDQPAEPAPWRAGTTLLFALASTAVKVLAMLAVAQAWGLDWIGWLATETGSALAETAMRIGVVIAGALVVWLVLNRWLTNYVTATDQSGNLLRSNRTRTLVNIGRNVLLVTIALLAGATVLSQVGVDTAPLLAGAGVVGLAVGFGAQTLVKDIITGLFILLGDTMRVGDIVNLGGKGGVVEAMSMRAVSLRDYDGSIHTIPYGAIDVVTNMTKDFSCWVFKIGVAYRENVDHVIEVLRGIDEQIRKEWPYRRLILEPLDIAGLDEFGPSSVVILARIKTRPADQWRVGREMQRRIKIEFDKRGIEIPFPHQTIFFGRDKDNQIPPIIVEQLRRDAEERGAKRDNDRPRLASAT
jgi:small-conductance mechanosensitive channel